MEVGMRRNPKAQLQRHRRWAQHTRVGRAIHSAVAIPPHPEHFNRRERHQEWIDLRMGREPAPWQPKSRVKWEVW